MEKRFVKIWLNSANVQELNDGRHEIIHKGKEVCLFITPETSALFFAAYQPRGLRTVVGEGRACTLLINGGGGYLLYGSIQELTDTIYKHFENTGETDV